MDTEIREGFLCPICLADLGAISDLQLHFEEAHSNEDKDVLDQIKGLFGKAKRKILGSRDRNPDDPYSSGASFGGEITPDDVTADGLTATGYHPSVWDPQELGATRCCTAAFKHVREARLDRYVVETNKLVIRLDKLLSTDAPTDPSKRKAFEKNIVPWAPDSCVNLCTTCGKSFGLTRRRHHCRLCGGVMCSRCSQFLPHSYARKMINPAFSYDGDGFRRSSSNSSLNSVLSPDGEPHLRTCSECRTLLERRDRLIEQRNARPIIVQLYEVSGSFEIFLKTFIYFYFYFLQKLRLHLEAGDSLLPRFLQMADSLSAGETVYSLMEATQLRLKILKSYESADVLSKRILKLGLSDPDTVTAKSAQLQRNIRSSVSGYLQQNLLGLQTLPTEKELDELQETRQLEAQRRLEDERRTAEANKRKMKPQKIPKTPSPVREDDTSRVVEAGWKPTEVNAVSSEESDPMIQQMNIIRGYVKQAKQARKWDEVKMLEDNLKELQLAYWSEQRKS
ncbi:hypothetical protein CAPTEDRAFT_181514 [Capitella teleta]|uniref:FYVE-type domain-containing protein n=1 Tax=Capitella teleta TaxID=283909 RepID=R7UZ67_CAPTE|nr:hypothetical protein CAPTEDRAFT_181514 [Capitella teleta]|eukprot:ELU11604.1 hypothetical protein CAPTEDRAFT_181514 [Capitella teleta]